MLGYQIIENLSINAISICIGIATAFKVLKKNFTNGVKVLFKKDRVVPPALLSDTNFGTHRYLHLKERDIKLHYVEAGDANMPLLLCLHGFPECWFSWRYQLKEFSSQFRVVAVDLRGYGDSDKPKKASDYSFRQIVEDIKNFIQELEPVDGKCSILGHDWGGTIAWILVENYPHLIQRHISLNAPHPNVMYQLLRSSFSQIKRSWYMFLFRLPFLPEIFLEMNDFEALENVFKGSISLEESFTEEVVNVYKYYWFKGGIKYPLFYYKMALKSGSDSGTKKPSDKIDIPTLIIWGKQDSALSGEIPKRMIHLCSDIQYKKIETAGHFVHEEEPVLVNEIITDYIRITKEDANKKTF